jgi:hypothetical protein
MKRIVAIILCFVILLSGCSVETPGATVDQVKAAQTTANEAKAAAAAAQATATAVQTSDATKVTQAYVDQKIAVIPASANYEARITALESKITALETKIAAVPNNQQPQQNPNTPTGTVSYTVQNPAAMGLYQLNNATNISIRIFNNKADSRYVRPQITLTSYNGQNAGTVTATATVISNSMGQGAVVFSANAIPAGSTTQVLYIAASGGVSNGQYLVGSGNAMDILVTIQSTGTLSSLWNLSVTGSDVSSTTGM